jgi:hypothetical protein
MVLLEAHQIMSKKQKESKEDQWQFWQMAIETWQASGMSVSKFCEAEGLSESSFYIWRKKLAQADDAETGKQKKLNPSSFIEVAMPKNNSAALEFVLYSGNTLRISSGADSTTLNDVISALQQVGLC